MSYWWARPLLRTAQGATITFGSTIISCALALQIEKSANRLFFYLMPHKYAAVDQAYGLTQEQLDSVRHLRTDTMVAAESGSCPRTVGPAASTEQRDFDIRDIKIGFATETLFSLETTKQIEPRSLPQLWKQDVIACSMTG